MKSIENRVASRVSQLLAAASLVAASTTSLGQVDPYAAPPGYYSGVAGSGAALKSSLLSAISSGHNQQNYGAFRFSAPIHDADPATPGNIILVYNLASVSGAWDSGSTWNREHVWPQSLQPGSVSNSSTGNLGDPHALRPANPSVNTARGNKPFGFASTTGSFGSQGSFYFPGDTDKGDIARSLFYSATRYSSTGLTLVDGAPGSNQMGGLADLVAWHYLDIPDEFERRRNHAIYSDVLNPTYHTDNRNAYIDLPGAVWSVFVDQFNDTQLFVGGAPAADGSSTMTIDFGASLVGTIHPPQSVVIHRDGLDGTYYAVVPDAGVLTTAPLTNNFTGAFPIGPAPAQTFDVGFSPIEFFSPGNKAGQVTIDNLDYSLFGGAGRGGNDADDTIELLLDVLSPGTASFDDMTTVSTESIDLGTIAPGAGVGLPAALNVLEAALGPTAGQVFEIMSSSGDTAEIVLGLTSTLVQAGDTLPLTATLSGSGSFSATYTIGVQDDPGVLGATTRPPLTLTIEAMIGALCVGDIADDFGNLGGDGMVSFGDFLALLGLIGPCPGGLPSCTGDIADDFGNLGGDGQVSFGDFLALLGLIGPCP